MNHLQVRWAMNFSGLSGFLSGVAVALFMVAMVMETIMLALIGGIFVALSWAAVINADHYGTELERFIKAKS